ncbi:MAG TPA: LamG-like jellyroll fold domain-containing protein [Candidatus Polarisedimenticolia bacterium]|nr:LamG-like jellyroll fold domain-containing protein [Candidatus Polarisedimenticolia bacterium]
MTGGWRRGRLLGGACAALLIGSAAAGAAAGRTVARWSFEPPSPGSNGVEGGPPAEVQKARPVDGRSGKALAFQDWSLENYLKPDPTAATRVVIAHSQTGALDPAIPFQVRAWIHPTADPIYYGGIVEKGQGYGASYRLVLLRGLRVQASLGDRHVTARSTQPLSLNEWHEVVLRAADGALILMVDGKEAARSPIPPGTKLSSTDPLIVGERFSGRIDEVELIAE